MSLFETIVQLAAAEETFTVATIISGPDHLGAQVIVRAGGEVEGGELPAPLVAPVRAAGAKMLETGAHETVPLSTPDGTYEVFFESFIPSPKIVIIGAVEIGQSLCRQAKELGYRVIVTDARAPFVTSERFPEADELLKGWPQEVLPKVRFDGSTYVVLLSHDPKFDEPTLQYVLPLDIPYVGAIGSARTQAKRWERLREEGFESNVLAKLHGPVGLDLGGRSAAEIALSILAEITAVRYGRDQSALARRSPSQL